MKRRIFAFILALVIMIPVLLTSCNKGDKTPTDSDTSESQSETENPTSPSESESESGSVATLSTHEIIKDGKMQYTIVRPDTCSGAVQTQVMALYNIVKSITGQMPEYLTDMSVEYLKNKKHDENKLEIIIGKTNYEGSTKALEEVAYGDYRITAIGRKIYIVSWSEEGVIKGVSAFITMFNSALDESRANVTLTSEALETVKTYSESLNDIPSVNAGKLYSSYDCGDSCNMLCFNEINSDDFTAYTNGLISSGYKEYSQNTINDNRFMTLVNNDKILNVVYSDYNKELRVISESTDTTSLPIVNEAESSDVCKPLFIQIGVSPEKDDHQNGECYVIRLKDGSFIICDGGFMSTSAYESGDVKRKNARNLYDTLVEYSPEGTTKPRISAWIFTHAHGDHIGAFRTFAATYGSKVSVDYFIFNFPSDAQHDSASTSTKGSTDVKEKIAQYFSNAKVVKAHPGQYFTFAGCRIDVMMTIDMYAPKTLTYFNTSTVATRVTLAGQTIFLSGDLSEDLNRISCSMYNKALKCDFVQVAHHGYQGGSSAFYRLVDPTWVVWPVGPTGYTKLSREDRNAYFKQSNTNVKGIYVANFDKTVFELPFDGTNYTVTPLPTT